MDDKELEGLRNVIASASAMHDTYQTEYDRHYEFWTGQPRTAFKMTRRSKINLRVRSIRTTLAYKLAPWLEDY